MSRLHAWLASRGARRLALAAMMLLLLLRIPYAGSHMGLARDFLTAWRIVHAVEFPPYGPVLNDTIHLGPAWFYLFAGLLALARSWLGTLVLLGVLAALQIPLAYRLGKAVHSRRAGLLFAVGLLVPNWATVEWLLPSHPLLSTTIDLALLLCAVRFVERSRVRDYVAMAVLFVLAVHAHPANAGLVWIVLGVTVLGVRRRTLRAGHIALAAALALLPLLPFFWWDAMRGFAELHGAHAYLASDRATGTLATVPALFAGVAWGGTHEWFATVLGWSPAVATGATFAVIAGGLCGVVGLAFALRERRDPFLVAAVLGLLALLPTVVAMRAMTPYYMAAPVWLMLAGIVACGLASLGDSRLAGGVRATVAAVAIAACVATLAGSARVQDSGAWPFAWVPMFDIKQARAAPLEALPMMPAWAQARSGRFLCAQTAPSVHGAYAGQLVSDHAVAMRLACGRADVHIGGVEPARSHWLGLSRAMLRQLGVQPARRIGSLGLVLARPIGETAAMLPPDEPVYPARVPPAPEGDVHAVHFRIAAGERLAVTNLAYGFASAPVVTVRVGERLVPASASDAYVAVYACDGCPPGSELDASVEVRGGNFAATDMVLFRG